MQSNKIRIATKIPTLTSRKSHMVLINKQVIPTPTFKFAQCEPTLFRRWNCRPNSHNVNSTIKVLMITHTLDKCDPFRPPHMSFICHKFPTILDKFTCINRVDFGGGNGNCPTTTMTTKSHYTCDFHGLRRGFRYSPGEVVDPFLSSPFFFFCQICLEKIK